MQAATGFNVEEGKAWAAHINEKGDASPLKAFPVQCLDHAAGQLLAFGTIAALCKTIEVWLQAPEEAYSNVT